MAQPTYNVEAIILKKTKLGESDIIVTMLSRDGSQLRAVAKGARKPGGAFAGKLELYNSVDLLCSRGRSLDIIKEARLNVSHINFSNDIEKSACASCVAELAEHLTQPELKHPRLYDLLMATFDIMSKCDNAQLLYICAASLLKLFSFAGLMPQLDSCAICDISLEKNGGKEVYFSLSDGGGLCATCANLQNAYPVNGEVIALAASLLKARYKNIADTPADKAFAISVLELCRDWNKFHVGTRLKSLDFLLDIENTALNLE
ncbi:DNA repair protein RecO [Adlercreutzia sp. ZJ304]|uniref:DNA repair protein RecO n=1 Tax=Adlercreutzia sp. ZJ304 TaxID=2709791 RepID=UPI0013E9BAEA|nr:DNA repair protein RecO [Adlercreutzia sp. ZJ304]